MSSHTLIKSNSSILPTYESNQHQHNNNTRTRSSSSASDDPTRKRMTHLTTRLKNAFRISHQPTPSSSSSSPSPSSLPSHSTDSIFPSSAPMKSRSFSLPSSHHHHQNYYFPSDQLMTKSRPLSCVIEQSTDMNWMQEGSDHNTATNNSVGEYQDNDVTEQTQQYHHHHPTAMELDHNRNLATEFLMETPTSVPGLMADSACSSTVSEVDSLHSTTTTATTTIITTPMALEKSEQEEDEDDDKFVYEQQTEWINTEKHWYSDYKFPFYSKSAQAHTDPPPPIIQRPPKQPHEGILRRPNAPSPIITTTVLGKRPMPTSTPPHADVPHDNNAPTSLTLANLPSVLSGSSSSVGGGPFHKKKKRTPVIRFDKMVQVHATYSQQDYNRQSDPDAICTRLNATLAHQIKQELNLYKTTEMSIHEQSKVYTQLFC